MAKEKNHRNYFIKIIKIFFTILVFSFVQFVFKDNTTDISFFMVIAAIISTLLIIMPKEVTGRLRYLKPVLIVILSLLLPVIVYNLAADGVKLEQLTENYEIIVCYIALCILQLSILLCLLMLGGLLNNFIKKQPSIMKAIINLLFWIITIMGIVLLYNYLLKINHWDILSYMFKLDVKSVDNNIINLLDDDRINVTHFFIWFSGKLFEIIIFAKFIDLVKDTYKSIIDEMSSEFNPEDSKEDNENIELIKQATYQMSISEDDIAEIIKHNESLMWYLKKQEGDIYKIKKAMVKDKETKEK